MQDSLLSDINFTYWPGKGSRLSKEWKICAKINNHKHEINGDTLHYKLENFVKPRC